MKIRVGIIALIASTFIVGWAVGKSVNPNTTQLPVALELGMQKDSFSLPVTRSYTSGVSDFAYRVVNGQPQMRLTFLNPTVYRCGFEP